MTNRLRPLTDAQRELVASHLAWAVRAPVKGLHRSFAADPDELDQAVYLSLVQAAQTFDPSRGASFKTWAGIKVRSAVLDARRVCLRDRLGIIRNGRRPGERADVRRVALSQIGTWRIDPIDINRLVHARLLARRLWMVCRTVQDRRVVAALYRGERPFEIAARIGRAQSRIHQIVARLRRAMSTSCSEAA